MRTMPEPEIQNETHITSLLIHAIREKTVQICEILEKFDAVEIQKIDNTGKIIAVVESTFLSQVTDFIHYVGKMPGVINITLVYHHCEETEAMTELVPG